MLHSPQYSHPLNVVLGLLANELDSLKHVGDVIDAPLLDLQNLGSPVQIQHPVHRLAQQAHKLLGEQPQRGVIARAFARRFGC